MVHINLLVRFSLIFNPLICKRRVALPHHYRQQRHGDGKNIFVDSSQCSGVYKCIQIGLMMDGNPLTNYGFRGN